MKAVLLDAFGTLVEITDKRNPFKKAGAGREAMAQNNSLEVYTDNPSIHRDLAAELQSIIVYPDVIPTLTRLRQAGIKIAVASNLARPYGEEVMRLLANHVDLLHYSYLEGCIKPDREFFLSGCRRLGFAPHEVTMVGDSYESDFIGATNAGLNAMMIIRRDGDTLDMLL